MIEQARLPEQVPIREIIHPRVSPEMAFQSYEPLTGDKAVREAQKNAFLAGERVLPILDYPRLDHLELADGIRKLGNIMSVATREQDETTSDAVWNSAGYRLAEMSWLLDSERLIRTRFRRSEREIDGLTTRVQALNEELYGRPEQVVSNQIKTEIWAQADGKELVGRALQIKKELDHGVQVVVAGETIEVAPLGRPISERLPSLPADLLAKLKERMYEQNADVVALIDDYYRANILSRPEEERHFTPDDLYEVFSAVHKLRDPDGTSGVSIVKDPDATALSWETPQMAVVIGGRRTPIKEPEVVVGKVFHEYIFHGGRAVAGIKTNLPILGTGLFTDAEPHESSDYLTFEEGVASLGEIAVTPEDTEWKPLRTERYLAIALAYEGKDFRQTFETLWRSRVLMMAKSGIEPTDKSIATAKSNSYTACERVFRGTPSDMPRVSADGSPRILTYNKDLAYLKGRLLGLKFLEEHIDDDAMMDLLLKAKFDPTNHRQLEIVRRAYGIAA